MTEFRFQGGPPRFHGGLQVRRAEDDLPVGRVLHDGQAWVAEARRPNQTEIRQDGFASPEAAAAWLLAQESRPTPAQVDPDIESRPGGHVVLRLAERGAWRMDAVLRGRPAYLPVEMSPLYARLRVIVRKGGPAGRAVAVIIEDTDAQGKILLVARIENTTTMWKPRHKPYRTVAHGDEASESRLVEALVRLTMPPARTAHETIEDQGRGGREARKAALRRAHDLRQTLAASQTTGAA